MDERNDDQPDLDTGPTPRTALDAARDSEQYAPRASDTAPTRIPDGIRLESPAPARRRSSAPAPVEDPTIDVGRLGIPDAPGAVRPVSAGIASRDEVSVLPEDAGERPRGRGEQRPAEPAPEIERESDTAAADPAPGVTRRDRLRAESGTGGSSSAPESASMLTPDRLLEVNRKTRPAPTGGWNRFVYGLTFHTVNLGDSAKVQAWKAMDERIGRQFEGGTRFVPVMTRKGGVGKTTVTTLLGMALADSREDRIIAVDANPDRGTLAERVPKQTRSTVRDVVNRAAGVTGFTEFSTMVSRDETRLDVLASDTDPQLSEAFDEDDYNVVADLVERFYSIMLTDCGTGIVHSVMRATLQRADSVVIVSGGSVDEARLASETLTWLDANGYGDLVRNAVVALNTATQGTSLVKLEEIESHFRSRVRDIVRIPYDPVLAAGSVVKWEQLRPATQEAARLLAALVVEGIPVRRA
ncbi:MULTISPECIES: MinD/ParA family protein [unclassified Rathayibacter]|uniref:MinD/ParA family ATP-binding protein n=1 Tax=unclassified Rathayibacter TaxID=2609250 RepID=UPI000F9B3889|nr:MULTISPECIES: MinD/ParA family protein [unclassified Rathayibacter]ROP50478.1 MinD-like ATPase involved in chromosome partitioning or flagellar assembly [Rathayibacter sp. PhB186]ROS53437.1 MinD-like ATPase involved in chromosome partitioning or flagellar assembly [Rathayibacter sp. PhB185]